MAKQNACDIIKVLSTDERNYLVRNNGDKVKIDSLKEKYVVLLYMHFPTHRTGLHPLSLVEAYTDLYPKGDFEVVFVAFTESVAEDSHVWFNKYFSKMPWLAIPFYDLETRKHVYEFLSLPLLSYGECVIINPSGEVLDDSTIWYFEQYGADWYPFTSTRKNYLLHEEMAAVRARSLKYFLSSRSRDYVLTNNGQRVPIACLESIPVGLYFYWGDKYITKQLIGLYNQLKDMDKDFEIVLINLYTNGGYTDEVSFNQGISEMPWLAVPFGETKCSKLARMFNMYMFQDDHTALVVVKSGDFYEPYVLRILDFYGIEAYPFTRERATELEVERYSLFSLFEKGGHEFVFQNDRDKTKMIKVSELKGKVITMLFASNLDVESLSKLMYWYNDMKRMMGDGFEVIYVSGCKSKPEFDNMFKEMPWLALPFGTGSKIQKMLRSWLGPLLVGFAPDGKLLAKTFINNSDDWNLLTKESYPFGVHNDIMDQIYSEIEFENQWVELLSDDEEEKK